MSTISMPDGSTTDTLTSFVGRRHELAEARRMLGATRVLTLVGTGGTGKTRLALRLAESLHRQFSSGAVFVPLAEVRDPELLASAVLERLGLRDHPGRTALETVLDYIADREVLLVLDNCEHLVGECARFVDAVIRSAPGVRILATSRQTLRVSGEQSMTVPPMRHSEAVDLFSERATATTSAFSVTPANAGPISRICERLEGLPLAIELAAARVRALSPEQIEKRLDSRYRLLTQGTRGAPERLQTLRALVDWSYELCTPEERLLWERASVFAGGFDLDAAERVCCGDDLDQDAVLDAIDSLTDKSIFQASVADGAMRYGMLETLREYGADRLAERGETEAVRRWHRDWAGELAARWRPEWERTDQVALSARLRRENANFRVALEYCLADPAEVRAGLRIVTDLGLYWGLRALGWLDQALKMDTAASPERAAALQQIGWSALLRRDHDRARTALEEAEDVARAVGAEVTAAHVALSWGSAAYFVGHFDEARDLLTPVLPEFRRLGDLRGELMSLLILGCSIGEDEQDGDPDGGLTLLHELIEVSQRSGDTFWQGYARSSIARIEIARGHLEIAARFARQALVLHRDLAHLLGIAQNTEELAWVAGRNGDHRRAALLFGIASATYELSGSSPAYAMVVTRGHDLHVAETQEALGSAFAEVFEAGLALALNDALAVVLQTDHPPSTDQPGATDGIAVLTRREAEVAALVAAGLTNKEIAKQLVLSLRTAEGHVQKILVKLGLRSRAQVIAAWHARESHTAPADDHHPAP